MKAYGGVDVQIHILLTSALVGGEWSASRPCRFTPGERTPATHCIEAKWTPEPVWTTWRKFLALPRLELRPLGRPARSRSLHRLRYPDSRLITFIGVWWDWVHLVRWPVFGLLYQPRMIDDEYGSVCGMRIGRRNRSTRRKPATLSTRNPTWPDLGSNLGRRGGSRRLTTWTMARPH
jgi:hypothetical protein